MKQNNINFQGSKKKSFYL